VACLIYDRREHLLDYLRSQVTMTESALEGANPSIVV